MDHSAFSFVFLRMTRGDHLMEFDHSANLIENGFTVQGIIGNFGIKVYYFKPFQYL